MNIILISVPCYFGYAWAADKFCKKHINISSFSERLFTISLFAVHLFPAIANELRPISYIVYAILYHVLFIALVLLLFRADTGKKILTAALLITITTLFEQFCEAFLCCLFLFYLHTVKGISEPFLTDWHSCLIIYIRTIAVISVICSMSKRLVSVFYSKTGKWYVTLAIPLLSITAVIDVAGWGATKGIMVRSGGNMGLYYDQLFSHGEFCILTLLSMFAVGFYIFGMDKIYLEQQKSSRYHAQITAYKMLEEQYGHLERLRHDMKNHIIALSGLLENKDFGKVDEYLRNMERSGDLKSGEEITGNTAVDAILSHKRKQAEEKKIAWECSVQIPGTCCINEFDLCVLFGNVLDNAIEACENLPPNSGKDRYIDIQAGTVKKCFLLEVKNPTDATDVQTVKTTSKNTPGKHGIGLLNVGDVAESYNGVTDISVKDGIFTISILIPLHDVTI